MRLLAAAQSVPKAGRSADENEDAFALNTAKGRYAVADGVSTAARPEVWSQLLVHAFVEDEISVAKPDTLRDLAIRWRELTAGTDLPWYAEEKLALGSSATFVGLAVHHPSGNFTAEAVGDTCLFHVRRGTLLASYPLTRSDQFGRTPDQITTLDPAGAQQVGFLDGQGEPWDQLIIATDAMAKFLLHVYEKRREFPSLIDLAGGRHFADYVQIHRALKILDNDDTTLCVVTI